VASRTVNTKRIHKHQEPGEETWDAGEMERLGRSRRKRKDLQANQKGNAVKPRNYRK